MNEVETAINCILKRHGIESGTYIARDIAFWHEQQLAESQKRVTQLQNAVVFALKKFQSGSLVSLVTEDVLRNALTQPTQAYQQDVTPAADVTASAQEGGGGDTV